MIQKTTNKMILQVTLFVFITLVLTVAFAIIQQKTGLSFEKISLPQLAPAVVVLILFFIFKNLPARINLNFDKVILTKSLLALAVPAFLFAIAFFIGKYLNLNVKITENLSTLLPVMITGMVIGAFAEEIGWRSFLQPILEKKNSVLVASILVGVIWGLWHVGHYKSGLLFMTGFLLFTISASIIIAYLLRGTEYNLIISAIFHLSINVCFLVFFHNSMADSKFMLVNGLVWLIPAIGIVVLTGKDLIRIY
ncbi:MAG: CPBP family intramembrane metalloprotease [Bacteroidetes bacterium]|nr:CPBP family intramembrane metalloprotease [Bacteroidota bacterium]